MVAVGSGPHTKSIGDLSTFLSITGPQVSIGVEYVSNRTSFPDFCLNGGLKMFSLRDSLMQTPTSKRSSLTTVPGAHTTGYISA